jgi:predicted CXXCH cytochrome family protein
LLFLGAIPALADGGPHQSGFTPHSGPSLSGSSGINADLCAGCHRAHTAQGALLLVADPDLCLVCHGETGTGATTDVMNGVQYRSGQTKSANPDQSAILGALRGGGYAKARIDTANAGRLTYNRSATETSQLGVVGVLSSSLAVTSRHLNPTGPSASIVWGSGAIDSGAGASITMGCTSCHNPHGNGQYRILNPTPGDADGPFAEAGTDAVVTDVLEPDRTHNYTVIQKLSTTATFSATGSVTAEGAESGYLLYADQVVDGGYAPTVGDYFHRTVPWYGANQFVDVDHPAVSGIQANRMNDAPNGKPLTFDTQINVWCSQCHTRYLAGSGSYNTDSGDDIFTYRHTNTSNKPCTTCHVAHGSNAQMTGQYTSSFPYPDGTDSASSRLLKIDNRGTCQACHDPTESVPAGTYYGPSPSPVVP